MMALCNIRIGNGLAISAHAAVHLPERNSVYIFGGEPLEKGEKIKVNVLSTDTNQVKEVKEKSDIGPLSRQFHTAVRHDGKIYLWGGEATRFSAADNKLWCFDPASKEWSSFFIHGNIPETRSEHSACVINGCMLVFGGFAVHENRPTNTVLLPLNLTAYTWDSVKPQKTPAVPARAGHTASVVKGLMYIIGGWDGRENIQREFVQVYDVHRDEWLTPDVTGDAPAPRKEHCAVTIDDEIFVFGGYARKISNDLYSLHTDNNQWSRINISGPLPRPLYRHQCAAAGKNIIIIGGSVSHNEDNGDLVLLSLDTSPCCPSVTQ